MKFKETRPYADPDVAARKIVALANSLEPYMDMAATLGMLCIVV
jgi:hypothetical protein